MENERKIFFFTEIVVQITLVIDSFILQDELLFKIKKKIYFMSLSVNNSFFFNIRRRKYVFGKFLSQSGKTDLSRQSSFNHLLVFYYLI